MLEVAGAVPAGVMGKVVPMTSCAHCGSRLSPGASLCPVCGVVTPGAVLTPHPTVNPTVNPVRSPTQPGQLARRTAAQRAIGAGSEGAGLSGGVPSGPSGPSGPNAPDPRWWAPAGTAEVADSTSREPSAEDVPTGPPEPTEPEDERGTSRPGRARAVAAVAALLVLAGGALAVKVSGDHSRALAATQARQQVVGRECVAAVVAGERTFAAGTQAVATMAGVVADGGDRQNRVQVERARAAVTEAQRSSRAGLESCATNVSAPAACVHSASVLLEGAARQEQQAGTLAEVSAAAAKQDRKGTDAGLATLTRQRQELALLVPQVRDLDCAAAAGVSR